MTELVPFVWDETTQARGRAAENAELATALQQYLSEARSTNTLRAYRSDWARFAAWCATQGLQALPAEPATVALYLAAAATPASPPDPRAGAHHEGYRASTLARWAAAIAAVHAADGRPSPTAAQLVRDTLRGIRRVHGTTPAGKDPLLLDGIRQLLAHLPAPGWPSGPARRRDRFLILAGFAGAARRSELVALDVGDITPHHADGLHLRVRRSKTDQDAAGAVKALPYGSHPLTCPVCAWLDWIEILDTVDRYGHDALRERLEQHPTSQSGHRCRDQRTLRPSDGPHRPVFRPITRHGAVSIRRLSAAAVGQILQRYAAAAGMNPDRIGGHSLRAGFVTQAARAGASNRAIMRQTGHRSHAMVDRYVREAAPLRDNAVTELGL